MQDHSSDSSFDEGDIAEITEEVICIVQELEAGSKRPRQRRHSDYQYNQKSHIPLFFSVFSQRLDEEFHRLRIHQASHRLQIE